MASVKQMKQLTEEVTRLAANNEERKDNATKIDGIPVKRTTSEWLGYFCIQA